LLIWGKERQMARPIVRSLSFRLLLAAVLYGGVTAALATPPKLDPHNPPHIGFKYYPIESRRLHEQGVCKVKMSVGADGAIRDIKLTLSTGFARLDDACLQAFAQGGLLPAIVDGKPIDASIEIPITWKITPVR
jgi:TonB family protein